MKGPMVGQARPASDVNIRLVIRVSPRGRTEQQETQSRAFSCTIARIQPIVANFHMRTTARQNIPFAFIRPPFVTSRKPFCSHQGPHSRKSSTLMPMLKCRTAHIANHPLP